MDESRSGKDVDGGIFRCLGFRFFQRNVIYDVHPIGNLGVAYVCIYPHEDGTFEGSQYEHTMAYFLPGTYSLEQAQRLSGALRNVNMDITLNMENLVLQNFYDMNHYEMVL